MKLTPQNEMSIEQQIAKLQGHARALADELGWILQCFELVRPAIEDLDLQNEFSGLNNRKLGFHICRISMARYCILGITRLTYDRGPQNPTARRLIEVITWSCADHLHAKLKVRFAHPIAPGEVPGRPPNEVDLATF